MYSAQEGLSSTNIIFPVLNMKELTCYSSSVFRFIDHMMISTHTYLFHVVVVQIKFCGVQKEQNNFVAELHVPAYDEHKTQSSGSDLWMDQSNTMPTNTK